MNLYIKKNSVMPLLKLLQKTFRSTLCIGWKMKKAIMNFLTDNNARLVFVNMLTAIFLLIVVLSIILPKQKRIRYWIIR